MRACSHRRNQQNKLSNLARFTPRRSRELRPVGDKLKIDARIQRSVRSQTRKIRGYQVYVGAAFADGINNSKIFFVHS
jgi:hypothetical protein